MLAPKLLAPLDVVVGLAVVGDPVARAVGHGLVAGVEVDDAEPPVGEAGARRRVLPEALAVGAAVLNQPAHDSQLPPQVTDGVVIQVEQSCDTAHDFSVPTFLFYPTRDRREGFIRKTPTGLSQTQHTARAVI